MTKKHTKNFEKLRNKILLENALIECAIAEQKQRVDKLKATCKHDGKILKVPFKSGAMFDRYELRLCPQCGIQESGWSPKLLYSGYGVANRDVDVEPEELYQVRSQINGRT